MLWPAAAVGARLGVSALEGKRPEERGELKEWKGDQVLKELNTDPGLYNVGGGGVMGWGGGRGDME